MLVEIIWALGHQPLWLGISLLVAGIFTLGLLVGGRIIR